MTETIVDVVAPSFTEALREAAAKLGVEVGDLAVDMVDAGASAESSGGFRPVKIRARVRPPSAAPDGARSSGGPSSGASRSAGHESGGGGGWRESRRRSPDAPSYGPPPPPMDPAKITPALVEDVRGLATGMLERMEFPSTVSAERTPHGIRVAIDAGEKDQFLIGRDGETLAAFQHLLGRMMRAKMPDEAPPRIEVDVAGFRDRQIEALRELARGLMDQVRQTGEEVSTDPLPASERRIVHLEVAEVPGMETVTVGDGFYKRVIVRRATEKSA